MKKNNIKIDEHLLYQLFIFKLHSFRNYYLYYKKKKKKINEI